MATYKTKEFARFARKAGLAAHALIDAAEAVANGRWDADLGGGVYKQRIARSGSGKSGGFRTIVVFRMRRHSFFVHGFAKNDKANVSAAELRALKRLATTLLELDAKALGTATSAGELIEVTTDE